MLLGILMLAAGAAVFAAALPALLKSRGDMDSQRIYAAFCYCGVGAFIIGLGRLLAEWTEFGFWAICFPLLIAIWLAACIFLRPGYGKKGAAEMENDKIRLGTHGEDYGSWMSNPVFYMVGALLALSAALAGLSFALFHIAALGVLFSVAAAALLALLVWITWIRKQYSFYGGGMMERVHEAVLAHLDFDGHGKLLEVGCGSGALSIRAALTWPEAEVTGIDYWGAAYGYGQAMCEKNAQSEGAAARCRFQHGDANKLDFPDGSFDAVISNYVYHNIMGADKRALLRETLRVLKKGGVFALNDDMKPRMYGDMEEFAQELREMGYEDVRLIDTAGEAFGSRRRAAMMMLGDSRMLVGRK